MADQPWTGDACSLVDAFRRKERSPAEEMEATLAALASSELNAFSYVDHERALDAAARADVTKPFGGVPLGVKELTSVAGWPQTEASLVLRERIADRTSTMVARLLDAGAAPVGLTTSSEFGGVNLTYTKLNGATRNPWDTARTPGGSSGGSASAVAGALVPIATGGDGGGSIRIPAGFTGLPGLKNTYGRIPKGPDLCIGSLTAVSGCLSRSIRDIARYLDVCNGFDPRDPTSLPRIDGWEAGLGTHDLRGKRAALSPDLGVAVVADDVAEAVMAVAEDLARAAGFRLVDVPVQLPELSMEWGLAGLAEVRMDLGDRYPDCADDLTLEIGFGLKVAQEVYNIEARARIEAARVRTNECMAELFDQVDFVLTLANPDVAFGAEGPLPSVFNGVNAGFGNNGALTIPSNIYGNPAIALPAGTVRGLPVSVQVLAPHHRESWLLDLGLLAEREQPWPLVAPEAPA